MTRPAPVLSAALLLAFSALWAPAQAQNVYRCGESYSNSPCAGATIVATDDARSPAQRAQAEAAVRRDASLAQALEKDRLRLEAKAAPAVILATAHRSEAPVAAKQKPAALGKGKKPDQFTAVSPKKPGEPTHAKNKKKPETA